MEIDAPAPPT
jgi:hypothetical protein